MENIEKSEKEIVASLPMKLAELFEYCKMQIENVRYQHLSHLISSNLF